jgi:hypothetical protein
MYRIRKLRKKNVSSERTRIAMEKKFEAGEYSNCNKYI